ncbi:MAG TPA: M67 family metallopeptidase [Candidatus Dormibacteraeota bacterium]
MRISQQAMEAIRAHAKEGYPYEICGVMVGPGRDGLVTEAHRAKNIEQERPQVRYTIDPHDQIRIERDADERGLQVVGYYHSHPDHPALASVTDAERSFPGAVFLIIACERGEPKDANAFVAADIGGPMRQEELEILE